MAISPLVQYLQTHAQPMRFYDFMKAALYAPGLGYYSNANPKIGAAGDFITASSISPLFAKSLASQFAQILAELNKPKILELGAGTGEFALQVLTELKALNCLPDEYLILDVSGGLKAQQQALFEKEAPQFLTHVKWIDALPEAFEGIIFGNEVLDAMPVHRFIKTNDGIKEQGVNISDNIETTLMDPDPNLLAHVEDLESALGEFEQGYLSEVNLAVMPWLISLSSCLKKGVILLIDYGYGAKEYYQPTRHKGTLQCYHKHQVSDNPFENIGEQDITAHVDFTHVAQSATDIDLDLLGYTTQMYFLLGCGIEKYIDPNQGPDQAAQIRKLMMPTGMGEMFKVIGLGKAFGQELIGFSVK